MSILNRLGIKWVYRRCPHGHIHNINKDDVSCGHGGIILDWVEEYRRWIPNPTKTEYALEMIKEDDEFSVERDARAKLENAVKEGDLRPMMDMKKMLMKIK